MILVPVYRRRSEAQEKSIRRRRGRRPLEVAMILPAASWFTQSTVAAQASRPLDIAFEVQMIDPGFSEAVAVADFNKDGRLDILSASTGTKRPPGPAQDPRHTVQWQLHRQLQRSSARCRRRRLHRCRSNCVLCAADRLVEESWQASDRGSNRKSTPSVQPNSRSWSI